MSSTDELIQNAASYQESFDRGDLPLPPAKKVAVVACMDARIVPSKVLGIQEGDAHVIRNAGGVVTDEEIRSLAISQHLLGTEEIILIHHTDCGMLTYTEDRFPEKLEAQTGVRPNWTTHSFTDLEADLRKQVEHIEASPFIPHKNVRAFVYEVESGRLREVT